MLIFGIRDACNSSDERVIHLIDIRSARTRVEGRNKSGKLTLQHKLVVPRASLAALWCLVFHECCQEIATYHHFLILALTTVAFLLILFVFLLQ